MTSRPSRAARVFPASPGFIAAPGEGLCLDFVNTRSWRGRETPAEELHALEDVLDWLGSAGGVDAAIVTAFRAWWRERPQEATASFAAAIALRETIFRIFTAVATAEAPGPNDLDDLNATLGLAVLRARMEFRDGAFVWSVDEMAPAMTALLSPVLWSAGDLLSGARRQRVRQCANPQCRWVFLDDSKSGNRRWCSMASCGNRAKAHRHYLARRKEAG